jgi:hypothetical protein
LTAVSIALCSAIVFDPHKNSCGGIYLAEKSYVLRDRGVNARRTICPAVFASCEWRIGAQAVTLTQGAYMLSTPQKALSMSAKASPTAAAAPAERREQPVASSAIAHASMANAIRALAMDAVEQAKSGHPGMPMGMADVATSLSRRLRSDDA